MPYHCGVRTTLIVVGILPYRDTDDLTFLIKSQQDSILDLFHPVLYLCKHFQNNEHNNRCNPTH